MLLENGNYYGGWRGQGSHFDKLIDPISIPLPEDAQEQPQTICVWRGLEQLTRLITNEALLAHFQNGWQGLIFLQKTDGLG